MADDERRARAEARRARLVVRKSRLQELEDDLSPLRGVEALSLVYRLTREAWALSGRQEPGYSRRETPCRFVSRQST
jgi:hypothetical protein